MRTVTDRILNTSRHGDIVFVGPNGSGKSRTLRELCLKRVKDGHNVIAISNTPYSRLPEYSRENYSHIRVNPEMTNGILKSLIIGALESKSRSYSSMREILSHTGYQPMLDVNISVGKLKYAHEDEIRLALEEASLNQDVPDEVRFLIENLHRVSGHHEIDLESIFSFFAEKELIALTLKHQSQINRILRNIKGKVSASFGLTREDGNRIPVHKASSGELTLITLAMFILTNSHGLDYVFIDEPENSLHPQWQSKFLSFISTVSRQEDINYQVASHSPVLLTGALTSERKVTVIRCRPDGYEELQHFQQESDDSVEELLWEAFDVITPASRFVAKRISDLLWLLEDGKISREKAVLEIEDFIGKSISGDQIKFLRESVKLVDTIIESKDVDDDGPV